MKKLITLVALLCMASFASPISDHGKLRVDGRKILDKNGNEFVLRGMSMFWNIWSEGSNFYNSSVVSTLASSWNANVVRVVIGNTSTQDAKNFMDWTYASGIYVIVDWHYHDMQEANAKTFFSEVAKYAKDKGYTHVLYEIFNEPTCSGNNNCNSNNNYTWAQLKTYAQNVIPKIREHDSDGIIIVGTPYYSADIGDAKQSPLTGDVAKNVMYTLHFYASDRNHGTYQTRLKNAYCSDFPVFISEWGVSQANGGGTMDNTMTNEWMSLVESLGTSWANWSVTSKSETSAALASGASTTGGWSDNNLTASGRYVKNILKRNTGASLTSVGLTSVSPNCADTEDPNVLRDRDGIMKINSRNNAANYLTASGVDSSQMNSGAWALKNSSAAFNVGFTLTEIPKAGLYRVIFRYGSSGNATVSWQGSGVKSGSMSLPSSGAIGTWKDSPKDLSSDIIELTATPSTPLNLSFTASGANNFAFVNAVVYTMSKTDSIELGFLDEDGNPIGQPVSVLPDLKNSSLGFELSGRNLILREEGNLEIYSLQGKRLALFNGKAKGEIVSLQNLPVGAYMAVLRKTGQPLYTRKVILGNH